MSGEHDHRAARAGSTPAGAETGGVPLAAELAAAIGRLAAAGVERDVRGWEKPSDHAPTWVELR